MPVLDDLETRRDGEDDTVRLLFNFGGERTAAGLAAGFGPSSVPGKFCVPARVTCMTGISILLVSPASLLLLISSSCDSSCTAISSSGMPALPRTPDIVFLRDDAQKFSRDAEDCDERVVREPVEISGIPDSAAVLRRLSPGDMTDVTTDGHRLLLAEGNCDVPQKIPCTEDASSKSLPCLFPPWRGVTSVYAALMLLTFDDRIEFWLDQCPRGAMAFVE
mmetsp:Transcript_53106/g.93275  ORF Transcript_53106/g.93275 Transcript_53106/m.93275 type:complete len:220 (-) Transcript_53106:1031-1690(-)